MQYLPVGPAPIYYSSEFIAEEYLKSLRALSVGSWQVLEGKLCVLDYTKDSFGPVRDATELEKAVDMVIRNWKDLKLVGKI